MKKTQPTPKGSTQQHKKLLWEIDKQFEQLVKLLCTDLATYTPTAEETTEQLLYTRTLTEKALKEYNNLSNTAVVMQITRALQQVIKSINEELLKNHRILRLSRYNQFYKAVNKAYKYDIENLTTENKELKKANKALVNSNIEQLQQYGKRLTIVCPPKRKYTPLTYYCRYIDTEHIKTFYNNLSTANIFPNLQYTQIKNLFAEEIKPITPIITKRITNVALFLYYLRAFGVINNSNYKAVTERAKLFIYNNKTITARQLFEVEKRQKFPEAIGNPTDNTTLYTIIETFAKTIF